MIRTVEARARGVTLLELLVASIVGLVIILAIGQLDVTRILLSQHVRTVVPMQLEAGLAVNHMTRQLMRADVVSLLGADNIYLRIPECPTEPPPPECFDNAATYRWRQYRLADPGEDTLLYYSYDTTSSCDADEQFLGVSGLNIQYDDVAPPPPGDDPPVQDNNVLELAVSWTDRRGNADPADDIVYTYTSEVTIRAGAYTDVATGLAGGSFTGVSPCCPELPATCP
jgi:hypothetical protein